MVRGSELNKILYYCDLIALARFSEPITGATYVKYPEGPIPREMLKERAAWVSEGLAEIHMREVFRYTQHRLVPKGDHDELSRGFSDNRESNRRRGAELDAIYDRERSIRHVP